ncbi:hypothetical protein TanjilG_22997 [Lupinus angustifolius]|uniref:Uncharacterized protein n=2 Tax=Lupinus angustifolius TaxID=3871 RepID=A0A1J7FWC9_LUPAN|nr:hypothetical protein TanjilG_22997 [Lupinus angustifolius]
MLSISKPLPLQASPLLSIAAFSTAYERAEGANAVAEASNENATLRGDTMYKEKEEDLSISNDAARDGPKKAEEGSEMVRDTAKKSMDGRWKASQETSHKVRDHQIQRTAGN